MTGEVRLVSKVMARLRSGSVRAASGGIWQRLGMSGKWQRVMGRLVQLPEVILRSGFPCSQNEGYSPMYRTQQRRAEVRGRCRMGGSSRRAVCHPAEGKPDARRPDARQQDRSAG